MACNLTKIATIQLRDLEAALDLIGEMAMPVPANHAQDYMNGLDLHTLVYSDINVLIKNAFEAGWKGHEQWESDAAEYEYVQRELDIAAEYP